MPEGEGNIGSEGLKNIVDLLENLGWELKGSTEEDIPCTIRTHVERTSPHGVDGYMTYYCPHRDRKRGVIIESKSYQWRDVYHNNVQSWYEQTRKTLECVPNSDEFERKLNFNEGELVNAAFLGIWTNNPEEFDKQKFSEYVSSIDISPKQKKAFQTLVAGNDRLLKLSAIERKFQSLQDQFNEEGDSVKFFHPALNDSDGGKDETVTLEEMISDFIYAEISTQETHQQNGRELSRPKDITVVFYLGEMELESLNYMYKSLRKNQLTQADEIWVYAFDDGVEDDSVKTEFLNNGMGSNNGEEGSVEFKTLSKPENLSETRE
jgi:hypothetical protein